MAELFAGGHLRFINGAWRDDNGDPVEIAKVVRCKDCMFYGVTQGTCVCDSFDGLPFVTDNDYCSYGERKDNE